MLFIVNVVCTVQSRRRHLTQVFIPLLTQYSPPLSAVKLYLLSEGLQNLHITSPKGDEISHQMESK